MVTESQVTNDDFKDDYSEEEDFSPNIIDTSGIVVYSRDWTVETIISQLLQGHIDINPKFQRRNVWNDDKRSKLIDSILNGYPIPEIMLSEHPTRKKAYIVIDGKQRLMSLMGFIHPEQFSVWNNPNLVNLIHNPEINGLSYSDFDLNKQRELYNSSIRCTIISNVKNTDFLYELFYRLNSGSVPLSMQELRQALYHGGFSEYLFEITNVPDQSIHRVMRIKEPDNRLRDIEYILRIMAMIKNSHLYDGDLKSFLDKFMRDCNGNWATQEDEIQNLYTDICSAIDSLAELVNGHANVGRQRIENNFTRFNRVLFEVQVYCSYYLLSKSGVKIDSKQYISLLGKLCADADFSSSISSSTKDINRYQIRYRKYLELIYTVSGIEIDDPFDR